MEDTGGGDQRGGRRKGGDWTGDDLETLKAIWPRRSFSASDIGKLIGKSRNAVLGKVHRIGLAPRGKSPAKYATPEERAGAKNARKRFKRQAKHTPSKPRAAKVVLVSREPERVFQPDNPCTFWELRNGFGQCRYPIEGEGIHILYCAAPTAIDTAWCAHHHGVVYRPSQPRQSN